MLVDSHCHLDHSQLAKETDAIVEHARAVGIGHMVTIGTQLQVADTGVLAITNQRAVYLGSRKTVDMPYAKLLGMQLYSDAISFSLSNRVNAPLIKVTMNTDVLGALLNAAVQAANV